MSLDWWRRRRALRGLGIGLARGAATAAARQIDPSNPISWEFTAFSQNGEDGIIDYLTRQITQPNRYFIEIGASNGLDNNSAWLAVARRYSGLMIEARPSRAARARATMQRVASGVEVLGMYVNRDNVAIIREQAVFATPDMLSLDIDGIDYHVLDALLRNGIRPSIIVVEYNSAFGPTHGRTIPYLAAFNVAEAHSSRLYYGASVTAWRRLLQPQGYRFLTVESNGVNAFFIAPDAFSESFVRTLGEGLAFAENSAQWLKFREPWDRQYARISGLPLIEV